MSIRLTQAKYLMSTGMKDVSIVEAQAQHLGRQILVKVGALFEPWDTNILGLIIVLK